MKKKYKILFVSIILFFSCLLSCLAPILNVFASSINIVGGYTDVLDDLQNDENFNPNDYSIIADDYSLQVINLAESNDKEVFVYVYQPSANYKNLVASSIFV